MKFKTALKRAWKDSMLGKFYSWMHPTIKNKDLCSNCFKNPAVCEIKGNKLCLNCMKYEK